jgi:hypothetical protein
MALITSSKEDCIAKLMKHDMVPEGLPVGLGGSWTGGCEPWRKGSDELSLEIETDLSCLFRTTLWCHEQVVAAAAAEHQQTSADESSAAPVGMFQSDPSNRPRNSVKIINEPPEDDGKMPATNRREAASSMTQESPERKSRTIVETAAATLWWPFNTTTAAAAPVQAVSEYLTAQSQQQLTPQEEEDRKLHPWRYETEEQKNKRRQRDIGYAKKKREKKKIEIEVLENEVVGLSTENLELRTEGERLQGLLDAAKMEIERCSNE